MSFLSHAVDMAVFSFVCLAPVPLCWLLVRSRLETIASISDVLMSLLLWWLAAQCGMGIALGALGWLRLETILGAEATLLVLGIVLARRSREAPPGLATLLHSVSGRALGWRTTLLLLALAGVGGTYLCFLATQPVTEHDSLVYHLPQVAECFQSGSLTILPWFGQIGRYPYGWEVLASLCVFPFAEDLLVCLPNWIAWVLLGLTVYRLSASFGAARVQALSCCALCLLIPSIGLQTRTTQVDVALAASVLASMYFAAGYASGRSRSELPLLLVSLGLVLGTKMSGVAYAALVLLFLMGEKLLGGARRPSPTGEATSGAFPVVSTVAAVAVAMWIGGFWYMRNLIALGNPLGYVPVEIGGVRVFPGDDMYGDLGRTTLASLFRLRSREDWGVLWEQVRGPGLGIPFMILGAMFCLLPAALWRPSPRLSRRRLLVVGLLTVSMGVLYWHTPYSGDNRAQGWQLTVWANNQLRLAFPFLGTLAVVSALVGTALRLPQTILVAAAVVCSVVGILRSYGATTLGLVSSLFLAIWVLGRWRARMRRARGRDRWALALVLPAVVLALSFWARERRDSNRDRVYGDICTAIEAAVPVQGRVCYVLSTQPYLFYGRRLDRRVSYVPAADTNRDQWLRQLRREGTVLAVGPMRPDWEGRSEWSYLRVRDGTFEEVFADRERHLALYRIRP